MRQYRIMGKAMAAVLLAASLCLIQTGCSCGDPGKESGDGTAAPGAETTVTPSTSSTEGINQMTTPEYGSSAGPVGGGTAEGVLYVPGVYTGTAQGYAGPIDVMVEVSETRIVSLTATGDSETENVGQVALQKLPDQIVEAGNTQIDGMTGATFTSNGLFEAVEDALAKAAVEE